MIDTQLSDRTVAKTEDDRNRIVHHALGHISHNKMTATSTVVDGMPKYRKFDTWCTSCQKDKMHMLPHAHDLWNERAASKNAVWHIDLIGKFRSPSLGGNHYIVTIIDNYSRYCMAVPTKDKSSESVLNALKKCTQDLQATPKRVYTDWGTEFGRAFSGFCSKNRTVMKKYCPYRAWQNGLVERCNRSIV